MSAPEASPARIPPGGFRELGPIGWVIAKVGARTIRRPKFHLFNVLGQHKLLFVAYLPFAGVLLTGAGKLSRKDIELVILRVAHLRNSEYELQQHRRFARTRGISPDLQAAIFEGPDAEGLTDRQRVLVTATDEFVITRSMSSETWAALAGVLNRQQIIEFCMLAGNYDTLAAIIATLKVPLDFPD